MTRDRLEAHIDRCVAFLNAVDAPDEDDAGLPEEDCCSAGDDDAASSHPMVCGGGHAWLPGDPDDAELSGDEREPIDALEHNGGFLSYVSGGVPA